MSFRPPRRLAVGVGAVALLGTALTVVASPSLHLGEAGSAAHVAAPTAVSPAPGAQASPDPAAAVQAADAAVAALVRGRSADAVAVAATDTTTGRSYSYQASTRMTAASVAKVLLMESALVHEQDRGQAAGGVEVHALSLMIENSDNDAGDAVYAAQGGAAGFAAGMRRLGLSGTVLGPRGQWGLSTTTAADQLVLLKNLTSPDSPLTAASQAFALRLMRTVEPDQRWGVGAAADPSTPFANKNGWLPLDEDQGRWAVNSVGGISVHGDQVLMSVLTQHNRSLDDGEALVQAAADAAAAAVVRAG